MKTFLFALVLAAVLFGGISYIPSRMVVENTIETPVQEEKPAWMSDEDAVKAAEAVIKRKELEAEQAALEAEIKEREERLSAIEKELGF